MTEAVREEFEAWAQAHFVKPNLKRHPLEQPGYVEDEIQIAWEAWEAAKGSKPEQPEVPEGIYKLAEFGRQCFHDAMEGGDIDSCDAFEVAQKIGLLEPEWQEAPCDEIDACRCSEAGVDFPTMCFRIPNKYMPIIFRDLTEQGGRE